MKELEKACKKFEAKELFKIINKMKWKAPGHDTLVIDQFKGLGWGGKERFLELCNEIYFQGKVPDTWKQAITVPVLKRANQQRTPPPTDPGWSATQSHMKDGLPAIFIRFLRSWLYKRTMKIRLGTTLSRTFLLDSGVPQGSVLAPNIWNYNTGDIPTTITT